MASIGSLPTELLALIVTSIPAQTIIEDSYAVLLVNSTFYSVAQPHVLRSISLNDDAVRRYPPRDPPFAPTAFQSRSLPIHDKMRQHVRELEISVDGKQLHPNQSCLQVCHPNAYLRIHDHVDRFMEIDRWRKAFNQQMGPLGADLSTFQRLQSVTMKMRCPAQCTSTWQPWPRDAEAFLQPQSVCDVVDGISVCLQLTNLTIDTSDMEVSPFNAGRRYEGPNLGHGPVEDVPKVHVCSAISKMLRSLPKLRSFRLRRRDICPAMLLCDSKAQNDAAMKMDSSKERPCVLPSLEQLVIDLRLPGVETCHFPKDSRAAKHCKSWPCECDPCQTMQQELEKEDSKQPRLVVNGSMDFHSLVLLGPVEDPAISLTRHMKMATSAFVRRSMPNAKQVNLLGFELTPNLEENPHSARNVVIDCLTGKSTPMNTKWGTQTEDPF